MMGILMLAWGLVPAILNRMVSGTTISLEQVAMGSFCFIVGAAFIGLQAAIGRGARWALWVAFMIAALLLISVFATFVFTRSGEVSLFPMVLAVSVIGACWLAIVTPNRRTHAPKA